MKRHYADTECQNVKWDRTCFSDGRNVSSVAIYGIADERN